MSKSVKDVLREYDLEDRVSDAVDLIHEATDAGMSKAVAAQTIVLHMIHENTDKTWVEVCNDLGVNVDRSLDRRKQLIAHDIIDNRVDSPSEMARGQVKVLLEKTENAHSDEIHDGTKPTNWLAAATYLNEWIHRRETTKTMVAEQYGCSTGTITELSERLVNFSSFARAYTVDEIDAPLGDILARRRHTTETLRLSLNDTTNGIRGRLRSLEEESNYELMSEELGGVEFYWANAIE